MILQDYAVIVLGDNLNGVDTFIEINKDLIAFSSIPERR